MEQINIHAAKTQLSALVERAAAGEPFVIAKAGRPMVTVIPYSAKKNQGSRTGFMKGCVSIPGDFDRMGDSAISEMFEVAK